MATSALNAMYGGEEEELAVLESQWAVFRLGYAYNRRVFKGRDDISSVQNDRMLSARVLMDIADIVEREGAGKTMAERCDVAVNAFRDVISRLDTAELVADDIGDLNAPGGMEQVFDNGVREFDTRLENGHLLMSPYYSAFRCMGVYDEFDARFAALGQFMGEIGDPFFNGERTTRDFRTYAQPMFAVPMNEGTSLGFVLGRDIDNVAISEDEARRRPLYEYNPVLADGHRLYANVDSDFVQFKTTKMDRNGNETVEDATFSVDSVDDQGNQTRVRRSVNFTLERDLMSLSEFHRLRPYLQESITINKMAAERVGSSGSVPTKTGLLYAHFIEPYMDMSSPIGRLALGDFSGSDEVSLHNARSQRILKELLLSQIKTVADMADTYASLGMTVKVRPVMSKPGALELSVSDASHSIAVRVTGAFTATEDEHGRLSVYAPKIDAMAHKAAGGRYADFLELDKLTSAEEIGRVFDQTGMTAFRDRSTYRLGYTLSDRDDIDPIHDTSDEYHNRAMLPVLCNTPYLQENHGCGLLDESLNIYHLMLPSLGLLGVPALQLSNVLSGEDAPNHNDALGPTARGLVRSSRLLSVNTQQSNKLISTRVRQSKLPATDAFPARYVDVITTHKKVLDAEQTVTFNRDAADEVLVRAVDSARERAFELIGVDRLREDAYVAVNSMLERAHEMSDAGELSDDDASFVRSLDMGGTLTAESALDLEKDNADIVRLYKMVDGKGMDGEPVTLPDDGHSVSFELRDLRSGLWDTLVGRFQTDMDDPDYPSIDDRARAFVDEYVGVYPGRDAFLYGNAIDDDDFRSPSSVLYARGSMVNNAQASRDFLRNHFDDVAGGESERIGWWAEHVMVEGHTEDMRDLFDQYSHASDFVSGDGDVIKSSFNPAHVALLSNDVSSERALGDLMASAWLPDDVDMTLTEEQLARSLAASLWQRYEFDRLSGSLLGDYREGARVTERLRKFDFAHCVSNVELRQIDMSGQDFSNVDVRESLEAEALRDSRPSIGDYSSDDLFRESLGLDSMSDIEAVRNMRAVINNVNQTLLSMGFHNGIDCRVSFNVDASGILQYSIARLAMDPPSKAPFADASNELLIGQVGPICVPDARGVVHFPNGRYYVPPMRGHVLPRSFEHPGGVASRMGVTTYQQSLMSAVSAAVRADVMNMSTSKARVLRVGSAHSMNRFYGLQRTDAEDVTPMVTGEHEGVMSELNDARIRALSSLVMLPKSYGEGSDRADLSAMSRRIDNGRMMDDSHEDTLRMLGRPCSVPSVGDARYVDLTTWRDGPKQGQKMCLDERIAERMLGMSRDSVSRVGRNINRSRLVEDVANEVVADGIELPNFATAPIRDFVARHVNGYGEGEHDPMFRLMMANTNLMHCRDVLEGVGVAMMPFRGWCQDDGLVISSELAERVQLEDSVNGGVRGLRIGDKLSDCHGNKGTVACVIDRSWTEDEARERDLLDEWRTFADNGSLDIVVNPYSPVSRGNAGSIVEMVANEGEDFVRQDGTHVESGIRRATWLVHDKEVDQKTVIYDRENPGNHRNAGWQSNAAFIGDGVYHMLDDIYDRGGERGFNVLREAALMCGVNVDENGYINGPKEGYDDAIMGRELVAPTRVVDGAPIELTDGKSLCELLHAPIEANKGVNRFDKLGQVTRAVETGLSDDDPRINMLVEDVMMAIRRDGCAIDLPFALKLPDGIVSKLNETLSEPLDESACYATVDNGDSHRLPVLSLSCQHGSDDDLMGSMLFKSDYANIIKCAIRYSLSKAAGGTFNPDQVDNDVDDDELSGVYEDEYERSGGSSELSDNMRYCCEAAQRSLNKIVNNVYDKRLGDPKYNCINRGMVRCPYPYLSATSVWTPDPRLALDEVRIGPEMAKRLHVKDGDLLYLERSPVLQSSAHATLRACVDDSADVSNRTYGVAINPLMCQLLSGDFDGDTVAVLSVPNMSKEVQHELRSRTNLETRILDFDHPESDGNGACLYETVTSRDGSHEWHVPKVGFSLGFKGADMAYVDKSFSDDIEKMRVELVRDLCEAVDLQHARKDITGDMMREAIVRDFDTADAKGPAYEAAHDCVRQLSDKCAAALKSTTAVCAADLSDTHAFTDWLRENVVEVGAKGNEGRLAELRDYMNADMSDGEERARRELRDAECDMAISTKSQVTGLAGTFMKNALAVAYNAMDTVRERAVRLAMVLSEGAYQATLDVKCDPSAAFRLQDMLFHAIDGEMYKNGGKTVRDFADDMLDVFRHGGMGRCITKESAHEFASLLPSPEGAFSNAKYVGGVYDVDSRKVCGMRDKASLSKGMSLFEAGQTGFIDNVFVYWGSNVGGWVDGNLSEVYGKRHEPVSHVQDVKREHGDKVERKRNRGGYNRSDQVYSDQYSDDVYGSLDVRYVYTSESDSSDDIPDINYAPVADDTAPKTDTTSTGASVKVYSPDDMQPDEETDFPHV